MGSECERYVFDKPMNGTEECPMKRELRSTSEKESSTEASTDQKCWQQHSNEHNEQCLLKNRVMLLEINGLY